MKPLTVLCDLDGIVVDLMAPWLAAYNDRYGDDLTLERITTWDVHNHVKPECGHKIYDFIDSGEAYRNLRPLPGALDGIKTIEAAGHEVVIVSAGSRNLATAGHKLEWCKEFLGFSRKKVIIAHQKHLVRGDVFIDDSPEKLLKYRKAWPGARILTIDYPYNREAAEAANAWSYLGHLDTQAAWEGICRNIAAAAYAAEKLQPLFDGKAGGAE